VELVVHVTPLFNKPKNHKTPPLNEKRGLGMQFVAFSVGLVSWACILTHIGHEAAHALQEMIESLIGLPNLKL
jgi:hypothetical protein